MFCHGKTEKLQWKKKKVFRTIPPFSWAAGGLVISKGKKRSNNKSFLLGFNIIIPENKTEAKAQTNDGIFPWILVLIFLAFGYSWVAHVVTMCKQVVDRPHYSVKKTTILDNSCLRFIEEISRFLK